MSDATLPDIGGFRPDSPFFLAPLAGISDSAFRKLCRGEGAALVYTEMISAMGLLYRDPKTERMLAVGDEEKPFGIQIFGSKPEVMASAASQLDGSENAVLDVNMGCPVTKVVKNGDGSALMKSPDLVGKVIEAMAAKTTKPVTVKIRSGWDEAGVNAVEIAKIAESAGAAGITVHGRTKEQLYRGKADWGIIAEVKSAVSIPVTGNGDVTSGADALRMLSETGCDFVMIARGALGNPWIFKEARLRYEGADEGEIAAARPSLVSKGEMFLRHAALVREEKGEGVALREMRKHTGWYFRGAPGVTPLKNRVNRIAVFDALTREIREFCGIGPGE